MTLTTLTFEELSAILELIEFHDDWDECSERLGIDVAALYDKIADMRSEA